MRWSDPGLNPGGQQRLALYRRTTLHDRDGAIALDGLATGTCLGDGRNRVIGRSVLVATDAQITAALVLVDLDGSARRLTIAPPDLDPELLGSIIEDAEIDVIATDRPERFTGSSVDVLTISRAIVPADPVARDHDTEWVMTTSGTSGRPKLVAHSLDALTGAIDAAAHGVGRPVWSTFYDIRRYGGLQIFLRAILGMTDLVLSDRDEPLVDHLARLARHGVTAISGTPSHWRRVLMSHQRGGFSPRYIRLSGEISDQIVLDGLRAAFPDASIGHAYASTEAGVGFAVNDGLEGFPAALVDQSSGAVRMTIVDGSLHLRSNRAASRYVGADAPSLLDPDGFVDTGDLVERRGDRYVFVGRRGGIINVGGLKVNPEEVEAAINSHDGVRMSLVRARKSPLTGALVVADVVAVDERGTDDELKQSILEICQAKLQRHKVPAMIRFVANLPLTQGGKLDRVYR